MVSRSTQAERNVEERSRELHRELGLRDLVLTQVLFIIGLGWVGTAAKLGPSHLVFWVAAIVFFYLPSAVVVIYLTRLMPLEGGLYQWAKLGFSELVGFLVAWNLWLYVIVNTSEVGILTATYLSYAGGPNARWMAASIPFTTVLSCVLVAMLVVVSALGLGVGKWLHNAGGLMMIGLFGCLLALPMLNYVRGTLPPFQSFSIACRRSPCST